MLHVKPFPHSQSGTISYIVHDGKTGAVIDPVLDFDYHSGRSSTTHADKQLEYINEHSLKIEWVLETHAHADHLTAAPYIKEHTNSKIAIGEHINKVISTFAKIFNDKEATNNPKAPFDHLFADKEEFSIGGLTVRYMHTPGHTPACGIYVVENEIAFVGDTLFMPDSGTARCDFPGGDAGKLYDSITEKIFSLSDDTTLYMCHDYGAGGSREIAWQTTVFEQKKNNTNIGNNRTKEEFIKNKLARDKTLDLPKLIIPAIQVNIRAGNFPAPEDNGTTYLKIPINKL